jgi:hypothetical protein
MNSSTLYGLVIYQQLVAGYFRPLNLSETRSTSAFPPISIN